MAGTDSIVINLEARARAANNVTELGFSIVNDTYSLLPFRQAFIFTVNGNKDRLQVVSGLAKLTENSPYLTWLRRFWPYLKTRLKAPATWFNQKQLDTKKDEWLAGWQEWWPAGVYAVAIRSRTDEVLGWACFLLDAPPTDAQHQAVMHLNQSWGYCWEMLAGKARKRLLAKYSSWPSIRRQFLIVLVVLVMLIPIRQNVLAPAEIIALDATVVASPMDGVISNIFVRPNEPVMIGQPLFNLDDTVLRNRLAVLHQQVAVADAELVAQTQKSFNDPASKSELALLAGRARERRAELDAVREQFERINVVADREGIAVYADMDDWLGRPVSTGERIMQLADPVTAGVLIQVPVADALVLETGSEAKVFLTVDPLNPIAAIIIESSYQAGLSDEGIASYRLRAQFADNEHKPRIGLRGTAKVYGKNTILVYYLLRRPFAKLREITGW